MRVWLETAANTMSHLIKPLQLKFITCTHVVECARGFQRHARKHDGKQNSALRPARSNAKYAGPLQFLSFKLCAAMGCDTILAREGV